MTPSSRMKVTFSHRQKWLKEETPPIAQILQQYPAIVSIFAKDVLQQELALFGTKKDLFHELAVGQHLKIGLFLDRKKVVS